MSTSNLPLYRSTRVTRALQIASISDPVVNGVGIKERTMTFVDTTQPPRTILPYWMQLFPRAEAGGYLVLGENTSGIFVPKDQFEREFIPSDITEDKVEWFGVQVNPAIQIEAYADAITRLMDVWLPPNLHAIKSLLIEHYVDQYKAQFGL